MASEGFASQQKAPTGGLRSARPKVSCEGSNQLAKRKTPLVEEWGFVASEGFEPPKAEPADLQSDPFGRLGN